MRINKFDFAGFTLIEMLIVVAIVTILAAIAYPSYQESVRKAKRTEGQAALMQLMLQQERFYSQRNTYIAFSAASTNADEIRFKWHSGENPRASAYEISGVPCAESTVRECVQLVATPGTRNVDSGFRDPKCGRLMLTSTGVRSADGAGCWQ